MSKSEEMLRLERDLNEQPELREKLEAETKRIAEGGSWSDQKDEKGHDGACLTAWHCYAATLHSDTESKSVSCWKNYLCFYAYHEETRKSPKERIPRR